MFVLLLVNSLLSFLTPFGFQNYTTSSILFSISLTPPLHLRPFSLSLSSSKSVSLWHSHLFVPTHYNLFPSHSLNRAVRNTDVSCDFRVSMFYTRDIHKYVRKPKLLSDINSVATICFSLHREKPISKLPSTVEPRKIERIKLLVSIKRYMPFGNHIMRMTHILCAG